MATRAREALGLLLVPPKAGDTHGTPTQAIEFFDQMEIYPGAPRPPPPPPLPFFVFLIETPSTGSKITHFKKLHQKTGIPYSEMVRSSSMEIPDRSCAAICDAHGDPIIDFLRRRESEQGGRIARHVSLPLLARTARSLIRQLYLKE